MQKLFLKKEVSKKFGHCWSQKLNSYLSHIARIAKKLNIFQKNIAQIIINFEQFLKIKIMAHKHRPKVQVIVNILIPS